MRVLVVTNMYPSAASPAYGIFVKEQVEAIGVADPSVTADVLFINPAADGKSTYLKSICRVFDRIEQGGYDLVHVHYGLSGLFLLNPLRRCPVPVVMTLHGGDIQPEQGKRVQVALTRRILRHTDCAITLNGRMKALAERYARRVETIACAVNTDLFTPPEQPRRPLAGRKRLTVIFPSAHSRAVKNYPLFCRVVAELSLHHGIEVDEIELNGMSREETARAMASADLMLMTSLSEGSPQVVKEAMACNLPVVSTPVGDVETLLDGVDCCAVAPADPCALAERVASLTRGGLPGSAGGRERIFALGLDSPSVARRIIDLYKLLVSEK